MGRICAAVLRNGSKVTFRWMPWLFDIQYWLITKFAPTRWLFHHLGYLIGARGLMKLIAAHNPDVVISTYPGVTAVLGMLRENRRLEIPVQSAITDLAGLRYWAHPGVDLHYVTHPESIEEVEKLVGPGTVEWVRPPISSDFLMPRTRRDAREALDVPAHARIVLVSGGGWGVGDLEGAINSALCGDDTLVVCITGRNEIAREKLEQPFGNNGQVRILGFTEQMSDWMAAADAMIHATAGLTVLEAHIRGCPVVSYGFSAGHLRANNAAFERFGLAEVARSEHELETMLRHVTNERRSPDSSFASLPSIASRALNVRPRVKPIATVPRALATIDVTTVRSPRPTISAPTCARCPRPGNRRRGDGRPGAGRRGRREVRRRLGRADPARRPRLPRESGGQVTAPGGRPRRPARRGQVHRRPDCSPSGSASPTATPTPTSRPPRASPSPTSSSTRANRASASWSGPRSAPPSPDTTACCRWAAAPSWTRRTRALLGGLPVVFLDVGLHQPYAASAWTPPARCSRVNPRQQWRELMDERRPLYTEIARAVVSTDDRTPEDVAQAVLDALQLKDA